MSTDWASDTTRYIEKTVDNIRAWTVTPARKTANYLVYGLLVALLGAAIGCLLVVLAFRGLVLAANALPSPHDNAWIAWMFLGGIFCILGRWAWSRRGSLN